MITKDLIGRRFGRLTVINYVPYDGRRRFWECVCDCGSTKTTLGYHLMNGKVKSCGCLHKDITSERTTKHGESKNTSPEYRVWAGMKSRCSPNNYPSVRRLYYDRGIRVCKRWLKFENFLEDMGRRPSKHHSLDREDNDGGYCPSNCRWALPSIQSRNRRTNKWIEYAGKKMILKDWASFFGIESSGLRRHINMRGIDGTYQYFINKKNKIMPAA